MDSLKTIITIKNSMDQDVHIIVVIIIQGLSQRPQEPVLDSCKVFSRERIITGTQFQQSCVCSL